MDLGKNYKVDHDEDGAQDKAQVESGGILQTAMKSWYVFGPRTRAHTTQVFWFTILLAAVLPWYFASKEEAKRNTFEYGNGSKEVDSFTIQIQIQTIDPLLLTAAVGYQVIPNGNFSYSSFTKERADAGYLYFGKSFMENIVNRLNLTQADPAVPISFQLRTFLTGFGYTIVQNGDVLPRTVESVPLAPIRALMEYPFDSYSMSLFSRVYIEVIGVKGVPPLIPAPYSVTVKNLVSGWDSSESASKSIGITDFNTYELGITLSRYWVVTGFSVFVVVIMWLLSLGMFSMVFDVYFCHPTMLSVPGAATATGLLFSLPGLRNMQPGNPPTTTYLLVDVYSFYINMGIIAIAAWLGLSKTQWTVYQPKCAKVPPVPKE